MQNIIFPDGIIYNRENEGVRTSRINAVFAPIPELVKVLKGIKKGGSIIHMEKSNLSAIENGKQNISALTLLKIANALKVDPYKFLTNTF